jgi:hypothetical protein
MLVFIVWEEDAVSVSTMHFRGANDGASQHPRTAGKRQVLASISNNNSTGQPEPIGGAPE